VNHHLHDLYIQVAKQQLPRRLAAPQCTLGTVFGVASGVKTFVPLLTEQDHAHNHPKGDIGTDVLLLTNCLLMGRVGSLLQFRTANTWA
jgi:hypothetical protein